MTEITLKDGRVFNSRFTRIDNAIADIKDYLFCEYAENLRMEDIQKIEVFTLYRQ